MSDPDPEQDGPDNPDEPSSDPRSDRATAEARRYLRRAAEDPADVREERARVVELLSTTGSSTSTRDALERRVAASGTLAMLASDAPRSLEDSLPAVTDELREETRRGDSGEPSENRTASRTVRNHLVRTVGHLVASNPECAAEFDGFTHFVEAVTTDLDESTLRVASRALFATADERPGELASAAERLAELLGSSDDAVRAWVAGTVGRVAETHPDAVVPAADTLHRLLEHDDTAVQQNALEALATVVRERPDTVAPAADALRGLLSHEETAIQYNAAGVLGMLAADHPDAVIPAAGDLETLRDHDDAAVRRVATAALAQLAEDPSAGGNDR